MTETPEWDDRQMWGLGDLALFLGGSEDSFTGLLLVLITKAQATPENYGRLKLAFPPSGHRVGVVAVLLSSADVRADAGDDGRGGVVA